MADLNAEPVRQGKQQLSGGTGGRLAGRARRGQANRLHAGHPGRKPAGMPGGVHLADKQVPGGAAGREEQGHADPGQPQCP